MSPGKFASSAAALAFALLAEPAPAQPNGKAGTEKAAGKETEKAEPADGDDESEAETTEKAGKDAKAKPEKAAEEEGEEPAEAGDTSDEAETEGEQAEQEIPKKARAEQELEAAGKPVDEPEKAPRPAAEAGCGKASFGKDDGFWLGLCGFVALNAMHDSTQSFLLGVHNNVIARLGTYAGDHDQLQFTARDTRITIDVGAPAHGGIAASGMIQFDFNGFMPAEVTEHDSYVLGPMRMRHAVLRLKNPVVDVMAGQYHDLFGWGGNGFYPGTLAFLGVPGQIYHRQPQLRLSKTLGGESVQFEIAAAAARPVHKAAGVPDGQAGLRLAFNGWTGASMQGYGQPAIAPLGLGLSGVLRRFEVAEFQERPMDPNTATGWGFAANAAIPIIPATSNDDRANALTVTAEFSTGTGISDLYTELTGGALFPTLANDASRATPPLYIANIDSGIVTYDGSFNLHTIDWRGFVVNAQYYLPIARGRVWVTGTYSQLKSDNLVLLTPVPARGLVFQNATYLDASLFVALTEALQTGFSFQTVEQVFGDGVKARNNRFEFGSHLFF